MDLSLVPYQLPQEHQQILIKYRECMRNHAASIGGHANDGCGEFMPRAEDDSLTCAACGCHRNFHRREVPGHHQQQQLLLPHTKPFLLFKNPNPIIGAIGHHHHHHHHHNQDDYDRRSEETPEREEVNLNVGPPGKGGRSSSPPATGKNSNKRHRTKFTQEQKEKMFEFAERIGWRMQRQDDVAFDQFCNEVGVKRRVLKVWMHNNKSNASHRRRDESASQSPAAPSAMAAHPVGV